MVPVSNIDTLLPDLPSGPLDKYRKRASFDWKKLRLLVEDEENGILTFKMDIWKKLEADPLFQHSPQALSLDELRRITTLRYHRVRDYNFLPDDKLWECPQKFLALIVTLNEYSANLLLKYIVPYGFFLSALRGLGTKDHDHLLRAAERGEISGCFCLTEIAHGSNTSAMRTTATYIPATQEFSIHTPDFEAAKCWAGSLGMSATHGVVYAQLLTSDGVNHGLHAFVVPLRDPITMLPYAGVTVGDMGHKCGLNAVDNGFATFNDYRIPRTYLLSRSGNVTPDGQYVTPFKNARKRMGVSFGVLVTGRIVILSITAANLSHATAIATRYSAVRQQFGPTPKEEVPVIEYQLQQWRVFPWIAASFALKFLGETCSNALIQLNMALMSQDMDLADALGMELHALSAASKPLASWTSQRGIQECREACGGHGYLTCAGFSRLRDDNDANCTYEGENNVLIQQASNWLMTLWSNQNNKVNCPLNSASVIYSKPRQKCFVTTIKELSNPVVLLEMYEWLIQHLLQITTIEYKFQLGKDDTFSARNNCQVYRARTLALAYAEYFTLRNFWERCCCEKLDVGMKNVLTKLCSLYGLWSLETHLPSLYQGGYAAHFDLCHMIRQGIIDACFYLKDDAVSLADSLSPPDFILNSALGKSDGRVYQNLQGAFLSMPGVMGRPTWWHEMAASFRSKL